jgi:heme-degrading monooxygenase HmoA
VYDAPTPASAPLRLSADDDAFYALTLTDTRPGDHAAALGRAAGQQLQAMADVAGCGGAALLADDQGSQLVTLTTWQTQADYLSALHRAADAERLRAIAAAGERTQAFGYRLFAARSQAAGAHADLLPDAERHCCVITGSAADREKRDFLSRYNVWEIDRYIGTMPAFRSAAFFHGHEGAGLAEITQWASTPAFEAALEDPGFREHMAAGSHYCEVAVAFHRVVAVAHRTALHD